MSLAAGPEPRALRCAARADGRGDWMLGTAFPAARLLLVEQPFPWGSEGLRTSRFDRETALALEARAREAGVRVQAIRRPGPSPPGHRRHWIAVDTRAATRGVRTGAFDEDAELLDLPLDGAGAGGEADDGEPLYLVCTHGKHDPCCGQRGRPLVAALAGLRPDRVWQASHLGGCRFSPTLLVLPLGLMYGRVGPAAVPGLVADAEAGEVTSAYLRGRIGTAPVVQAALGFAHQELGTPRLDALTVVSSAAREDGTVVVRIRGPEGLHDVTVLRERVDAAGLTCRAPGASWFVAHRPQAIAAVEA